MEISKAIQELSILYLRNDLSQSQFKISHTSSSVSIYFTLAMINLGCKGMSASQLASLLVVDYSTFLEKEWCHSQFNSVKNLNTLLNQYSELNNKIYSISELNSNYTKAISDIFETLTEKVDIKDVCTKVNSWVKEKTHDRISQIISEEDIDPDNFIFLIINTIYFKSSWKSKFNPGNTKKKNFYISSDNTVQVEMMHKYEHETIYYVNDEKKYSMIILPFDKEGLVSIFVLPDESSNLENLVQNLKVEDYNLWMSLKKERKLNIHIPKFSLKSRTNVKDFMINQGITDIFDCRRCDMSGATDQDISVSKIIHSSEVVIDEEGVVATAATVAIIQESCGYIYDDFRLNRPFLFIIFDLNNSIPIFINAVINPVE